MILFHKDIESRALKRTKSRALKRTIAKAQRQLAHTYSCAPSENIIIIIIMIVVQQWGRGDRAVAALHARVYICNTTCVLYPFCCSSLLGQGRVRATAPSPGPAPFGCPENRSDNHNALSAMLVKQEKDK